MNRNEILSETGKQGFLQAKSVVKYKKNCNKIYKTVFDTMNENNLVSVET